MSKGIGPMSRTADEPKRDDILAQNKRIPDFFIVGHPKCGTTALYEMLRRHPQIYMPDLKEPAFFGRYLQYETQQSQHSKYETTLEDFLSSFDLDMGTRQFFRLKPDTLDQYLSLFNDADPEQRAGEASPTYLWSPVAASRIAATQPAFCAPFIFNLCDLVSRQRRTFEKR
jgi:hypothetical protein